jgi:hypothetical protein
MLFLELPLVLVQDVLEQVAVSSGTDAKISPTLRLREVNRKHSISLIKWMINKNSRIGFFECEVTKFYAKSCIY